MCIISNGQLNSRQLCISVFILIHLNYPRLQNFYICFLKARKLASIYIHALNNAAAPRNAL